MTDEHFALEQGDVDGVHVVSVHGELDLATAPRLCACLHAARSNGVRGVLLDLSDLSFCDSQGLRALIEEQREMAVAGKRFGIVEPADPAALTVFELVGAREFLRFYGDRREALVAL